MNGGDLTVEQLDFEHFTEHKSREEIMNAENNYLNDPPTSKIVMQVKNRLEN